MEMKNSPPQKVCTHQCQSILALPDTEGHFNLKTNIRVRKKIDGDLEVLVPGVAGAVKAASLKCDQIDLQKVVIAIKPHFSCCYKSVLSLIIV